MKLKTPGSHSSIHSKTALVKNFIFFFFLWTEWDVKHYTPTGSSLSTDSGTLPLNTLHLKRINAIDIRLSYWSMQVNYNYLVNSNGVRGVHSEKHIRHAHLKSYFTATTKAAKITLVNHQRTSEYTDILRNTSL